MMIEKKQTAKKKVQAKEFLGFKSRCPKKGMAVSGTGNWGRALVFY